jgi:AcrR family transcriptional regulator
MAKVEIGDLDWPIEVADEPGRSSLSTNRLLQAALNAFSELGYEGASTRDIGARAGMSPAALYIRFESKGQLLGELSTRGHRALRNRLLEVGQRESDPIRHLGALVSTFVEWHARYLRLARVLQHEMQRLEPEAHREVSALRLEIRHLVESAAEAAAASVGTRLIDPRLVARAILSLGLDLARWYAPERDPSPTHVAEIYSELALRMVGVSLPSDAPHSPAQI